MSEDTAVVAGDADTTTKELVKVAGIGKDIVANVNILPDLSKDMPLEQRKEVLRDTAKKLQGVDSRSKIVNGEILYEVSKNDYWKEWTYINEAGEAANYKNFAEYAEIELDLKKRMAYYLVDVYETFVITLGIPVEILREMDWTKALALKDVIDGDNWIELLDKTKSMSVREVKALAATIKKAGKETGGKDDTATKAESGKVTISFHPEQLVNFNDAVTAAKEFAASDATNHCVDLICSEYLNGLLGTGISGFTMSLDRAVQNLERQFGVKVAIKEIDSERTKKLASK